MERQNIENRERPVASGGLATTRRRFLVGASAAAGMVAFPGLSWAQDKPRQGGKLRYGMNDGSQQDTLDPASWATVMTGFAFNGSLCNNLVELLPDGSLAGDLAES
ncbi:MAG: twin-arginine translocation signal domain-containing protein, partial [Alphaproteobacteria bacterium]|nr:twin-arginine translocation signal domain-containing protein [Alphaproteobacteria bacterium]